MSRRRGGRCRWLGWIAGLATAIVAGVVLSLTGGGAAAGQLRQPAGAARAQLPAGCTQTGVLVTCDYSTSTTFTVPAGVSVLNVVAVGGSGGSGRTGGSGGNGGRVSVNNVTGFTPNQTLTVTVGSNGTSPTSDTNGGAAGSPGGGTGTATGTGNLNGGGGGGYSGLLLPAGTANRELVIGGAGGGGGGRTPTSGAGNGGGAGGTVSRGTSFPATGAGLTANGAAGTGPAGTTANVRGRGGGAGTGSGGSGGLAGTTTTANSANGSAGAAGGTLTGGNGGNGGARSTGTNGGSGGGGGGAGWFGGGGGGGGARVASGSSAGSHPGGGGGGGSTFVRRNPTGSQPSFNTPPSAGTTARVVITYTIPEAPAANPGVPPRCEQRVLLVLDESNSIVTFNAVQEVRNAATAFVDGLIGEAPHSDLAVMAFATHARSGLISPAPGQPGTAAYQPVTATSAAAFKDWINGHPATGDNRGYSPTAGSPVGGTNWQAAFQHARSVPGGPPTLVVFVTDGEPTQHNDPTSPDGIGGPGNSFDAVGLDLAVEQANLIKRGGSHIFGIGVGPDITVPGSAAVHNLQQVTGPSEFPVPNSDFGTADFTLAKEFTELQAALARIISSLCGSSLTITKFVPGANGQEVAQAGWQFTTTVDAPGGHRWLLPTSAAGTTAPMATATTNGNATGNGVPSAEFAWRLNDDVTASVQTTETQHDGFRFVRATCQLNSQPAVESTSRIPVPALGRGDNATCQVFNAPAVDVFTAYVDGFRPGMSLPTPWQGTSGTEFVGCNHSASLCPTAVNGHAIYDAGAIRIRNPSATADLTVTDASVTITGSGCPAYDIWGSELPKTVPPGGNLILTQTGGPSPCHGDGVVGDYNFDTSESNHSSTPCTGDGLIPTIDLTTSAGNFTVHDDSQILNTGGADLGSPACGKHNETEDSGPDGGWTPELVQVASRGR